MKPALAVVGMACCYPDARSPGELWENVLAQRRAFRRLPPERLALEDYAPGSTVDGISVAEAAVLEGYRFDRLAFRVAGPAFRGTDLVHWLALDVAGQALRDAGLAGDRDLPRETTGVLVGNTLAGEFSRAGMLRLRWPYVRRVLEARLVEEGWEAPRRRRFLGDLEVRYKEPFPDVDHETLAGGLSNTIAGRICSHFGLGGGGYTVDGACSSSLLAVANACAALEAGDLDVALAGGVDLSLDPFELVGFSKAGALATDEMRVYDRDATGFLPGEGCGFVVLVRHEDAAARGLRAYGLVRGWGVSSDGSGAITRPEVAGQRLALGRAYRRAGYGPDTVALFEGHGTGTPVGDEVELQALAAARREAGATGEGAAVGSIKANIGHTKAAAGAAGFIKATLAVHHQVLPPTTGVVRPRAEVSGRESLLRVLDDAEPWPSDRPIRAGVSSFGFGGINVHLTLEGCRPRRANGLAPEEQRLAASAQDVELILLDADGPAELSGRLGEIRERAGRLSRAELGDLAVALSGHLHGARWRAAVVAARGSELESGLGVLQDRVSGGATEHLDPLRGVFVSTAARAPRIAFAFPGQAAALRPRAGALGRRFAPVRDVYAMAHLADEADPSSTALAQPAIVTAELAGLALLRALGIEASLAFGHSLGELTALHWAGAIPAEGILHLARERGRMMEGAGGAMASLAAGEAEARALLSDGVVVACQNSPRQTVVSGQTAAVAGVMERARTRGVAASLLKTAGAFHSPLMARAAAELRTALAGWELRPLQRNVVSTVTGGRLGADADLRQLLVDQLTRPVRCSDALGLVLPDVDLVVEVGPGDVLTGLAADTAPVPAIALDVGGPSVRGALLAAGAAFVLGAPVSRHLLFTGRFARSFDPKRELAFLSSPCERVPRSGEPTTAPSKRVDRPAPIHDEPAVDPTELVRQLVAGRAELPQSAVRADSRLLGDLHLSSLTVAEIVVAAARRLDLAPPASPLDLADATVAEVGRALARAGAGARASSPETPAGLGPWVNAFAVVSVPAPAPAPPASAGSRGSWILRAPDHPFAAALARALPAWRGQGTIACIPGGPGEAPLPLLLESAQEAVRSTTRGGCLVIVHEKPLAAAFARTIRAEHPGARLAVVEVPFEDRALAWVRAEAEADLGYREVRYRSDGRREEWALEVVQLDGVPSDRPLTAADVVLVSGGGKGIVAACARALAEETRAALVLLGRSQTGEDRELDATLKSLREAGVRHLYLRADVTDADAVKRAVRAAESRTGPITALLHGAGVNRPLLLEALDVPSLEATLDPKVRGFQNLVAAVDRSRLRLLVAFGSVIGRLGMRGEADYALANACLTLLVAEFQQRHPSCRCLALETSVWSGIGMGERLGRVEALAREGITPIPPARGVELFLRLLRQEASPTTVVVSGRMGARPPMRLLGPDIPVLRFLERPLLHYPGVEVVAESEVSTATDPYLLDHVLDGQILLPAVLGLEAMAQAAQAVLGAAFRPGFENVRFDHPVIVPAEGAIRLRLAAERRGRDEVDVVLRSSETGYQVDHFRCRCRSMTDDGGPLPDLDPPGASALALDPARDLYGGLLFQAGRFRRLARYHRLTASHACAEVAPDGDRPWFSGYLPSTMVLGDPGARDACIHSIQGCLPHARLVPVGVDRLRTGRLEGPGPLTAQAREVWREGDTYCYDLEVRDASGRQREAWEGLRLRRVGPARTGRWHEALLAPFVEWRVRELVPGSRVLVALERDGRAPRPWCDADLEVSAAQAGGLTMVVAQAGPVSCDIQGVRSPSGAEWTDLDGPAGATLAAVIAERAAEPFSVAATRVSAARECLKKAGRPSSAVITLRSSEGDGWACLSTPGATIATCVAPVAGIPDPLVLAVFVGDEGCGATSTVTRSASRTRTS